MASSMFLALQKAGLPVKEPKATRRPVFLCPSGCGKRVHVRGEYCGPCSRANQYAKRVFLKEVK